MKEPHVILELPCYEQKKQGEARIIATFATKNMANNNASARKMKLAFVVSSKKGEEIIARWNEQFRKNDFSTNNLNLGQ